MLSVTPGGAVTRTGGGAATAIGAHAVILCTNGFGANPELIARYAPELAGKPYGGSPGSEGEAITWGTALGADLCNMGAYQAHASLADPHGSLVTWTIVEKGGVVVDAHGQLDQMQSHDGRQVACVAAPPHRQRFTTRLPSTTVFAQSTR